MTQKSTAISQSVYQHLVDISKKLNGEKNIDKIMESTLLAIIDISNADAGTIYQVNDKKELEFKTVINSTLDLYLGGESGNEITFNAIPIYFDEEVNQKAVAAVAAATGEVINIEDVYKELPYDFSAARAMDKITGYRTKSMLTFPLKDHGDEIVGVIQLINAKAKDGDDVVPFSNEIQELCLSFAALCAIALTNKILINNMEKLFSAIIQTMASLIDEKSPHTGSHCRRVPDLTMMVASAVNEASEGPLADYVIAPEQMYELEVASWLHDWGKIAISDHIMDKATKLHGLFDRIEFVQAKFEIARRDIKLRFQDEIIEALKKGKPIHLVQIEREQDVALKQLALDLALVQRVNIGGEFLSSIDEDNIKLISERYQIQLDGQVQQLLNDNEVENLHVKRGTLNASERKEIQRHMDVGMTILNSLPFPKHLSNVPEFALGHHETMDGKGYPRGLTKEQLSVPARVMAIADIFEALSSPDRPYKKAKSVSECLMIMSHMATSKVIDEDLFEIFVKSKAYEQYIAKHGNEEQLDSVDLSELLPNVMSKS